MAKSKCDWCQGKGWSIASRDDGRCAVEKCDSCGRIKNDETAARRAMKADPTLRVSLVYPCFVLNPDGTPKRWREGRVQRAS